MSNLKNINVGDVFDSLHYGKFEILIVHDYLNVVIRFISTGYIHTVQACKVRIGSVKDPYYPSVFGVGYLGEGPFKPTVNGETTTEYNRWCGVLERCYSTDFQKKHPTYIGCSVHPDWHNFQVFAEWFSQNKPDVSDIHKYHLDKDIKVKGNKVYSADTCLIVPAFHNLSFSNENKVVHVLKDPDGKIHTVTNVRQFSLSHNLQPSIVWKVIKGERRHHKNWVKHCNE